jgi:alanine racemase
VTTSISDRLAAAGLPPLPRTAWLELDLDALRTNLAAVRALVGPDVAILPVVKADAYGHGAIPITRALEAAGADGCCVAAMDEALALRRGGIHVPIHVLYPAPAAFVHEAARAGIAVAAGDLAALTRTLDAAASLPGLGAGTAQSPDVDDHGGRLVVEIEVETGLGRGGMVPGDVVTAAGLIARAPGVVFGGLWTHLQASEDPDRTALQLERFARVEADVRASGVALPIRHVVASGGLLTDILAFDGVRPGLSIYGLLPDELDGAPLDDAAAAFAAALRPVMSLHAQPVRVADVAVGDGVSYGPTWRADRPSRVATLPLGYGDGFGRVYSNRAQALVRGCRVPLVGNVAMDALMVDVTDVPGPPVTTDDRFTLLGQQGDERITAGDLARLRTTNRWEVVTQMASRLPRVYHAASAPVDLWTLTERRG